MTEGDPPKARSGFFGWRGQVNLTLPSEYCMQFCSELPTCFECTVCNPLQVCCPRLAALSLVGMCSTFA